VINLKTAKALGLDVPQSIQLRAAMLFAIDAAQKLGEQGEKYPGGLHERTWPLPTGMELRQGSLFRRRDYRELGLWIMQMVEHGAGRACRSEPLFGRRPNQTSARR
jgi:hypothetical protein